MVSIHSGCFREIAMREIINEFQIPGDLFNFQPLGSGHINDTFVVNFNQEGKKVPYLFQRINKSVFQNPPQLMDNVVRVTGHIRQKLLHQGCQDISRRVLTPIFTRHGTSFLKDNIGDYWRAYIYISGASTHDTINSNNQACEIAKTFGSFINMLRDLPGKPLFKTIPHFINGILRLEHFQQTLAQDSLNRASQAKTEIDFLHQQADLFYQFPRLVENGDVPIRITHNDTKVNNVMLDDVTGQGLCVVDLDTVMPGLILYDFGDLARTTLSSKAEDELDVNKIELRMDRFEAILSGFLATTGEFLVKGEIKNLVLAVKVVTQIIGIRFLTDFLAGDKYFKILRSDHNLHRCRTQFKLVQQVLAHQEKMDKLVDAYCSKL